MKDKMKEESEGISMGEQKYCVSVKYWLAVC